MFRLIKFARQRGDGTIDSLKQNGTYKTEYKAAPSILSVGVLPIQLELTCKR